MKILPILIALAALSTPCIADTLDDNLKELSSIQAQRLEILQSIVKQVGKGVRDGTSGMSDLIEAKIDLHVCERECAPSTQDKIAPPKVVADLEANRHAIVTRLKRAGNCSGLDYLKSKERLLAAKQLLLQLKVQVSQNALPKAKKSD